MKKVSLLFVAVVLALLAVSCGTQAAGPTAKIGFIGPLTGDYAKYGVLMSQAAELAITERNAAGGVGGVKVALVKEDSEGKVEKATAALEKLASVDKIWALVGEVFSSSSLAIAPRADAEKIVMISPSSTHPDLTSKGTYIFRTVATDSLQAEVFGNYVAQELKFKKVAILYTKNDYSQTLAEAFKKIYTAAGGTVVAEESFQQGDKDFKTQLTNIKSKAPDAILLPDYVAEIAQILEQSAGLGIKTQFLATDGFSNPEILTLAGKYTEGVIFSAAQISASDKTTKFLAAYSSTFKAPNNEADDFAKNSYDATNIIMDGMQAAFDQASEADKKAFNLSKEAIQAYVAGVKGYAGVSGEISFAPNHDVIKNIGINVVKDGKFVSTGAYKIEGGKLTKVQ